PEYCIDTETFYITNAALNVVSDLMILVLPAPIVWSLNTDVRKKVILTGLFSMGSVSCLVSVLRMRSIIVLYKDGFNDLTWGVVEVVIWSQAELTAAMFCTCTPCLRPLFEKITPMFASVVNSRKGTTNNTFGSSGKYVRTDDYGHSHGHSHRSTASKAHSLADIEMDSGIQKKVTVDVSAMGGDDSDSQKSIIRHQG
ncbi:hypothetical protein KCU63_g15154, partial [Aureobasidium melanogenum]